MRNILHLAALMLILASQAWAQTINTVAGGGSTYLPNHNFAGNAAFYNPVAVVADTNKNGNYYILDCNPSGGYGAVIYKVVADSTVITILAGTGAAGYTGDGGPATSATFSNQVSSIAVDSSGNIYISDSAYSVIRKVTASTGVITTVAGSNPSKSLFGGGYNGDGQAATSAYLHQPSGITVDATNLYIVDTYNYRVRKVNFSTGLISTIAGNGTQDPTATVGNGGPATSAELADPSGVAEDQYGDIYFVDNPTNGTTTSFVRKVSNSKKTLTQLPHVLIARSYNLAVDPSYNLYIINASQIQVYNPLNSEVSIVAGTQSSGFSGDGGPATSAELNNPQGVSVDISGNVYVADTANQRIREF